MHSLVDIKEVLLELRLVQGEKTHTKNPLGTDYDLADIYIGKNRLVCSPFLHTWSEKTEQKYSALKGIWLSVTNDLLFLKVGVGSKMSAAPSSDLSLFFPVPHDQQDTSKQLRLVVTCMN